MDNSKLQAPNGTPKKRGARRSEPTTGKYIREAGKHWTDGEIKQLADDLFDWYNSDTGLLWLGDFFTERMIAKSTISRLKSKNEYFNEIYEICKDIQESRLFHLGFSGANIQATIFALKNICKWRSEPKDEEIDDRPAEVVVRLAPKRLAAIDNDNDINQK